MADLKQVLEDAIVADPDDKSAHMAYGDYLSEQGDPRGEFIRVQLALEDESLPAATRRELIATETRLLEQHQREWLGELAPFLVAPRRRSQGETDAEALVVNYRRGWLDSIAVPTLTADHARAMGTAPEARLLRHLAMNRADDDEFDGVDSPPDEVLSLLLGASFLPGLRTFRLGAPCTDEIDPSSLDHGEVYEDSAQTLSWNNGYAVIDLLDETSRLEELRLFCLMQDHGLDLFSRPAMAGLRVFQAYHMQEYDLYHIMRLPGPPRLEQLYFMPHSVGPGGPSYLPRDMVIAFLRSDKASKLTHLQLRMSNLGDEGVGVLIETGLIQQLEMLDLRHGEITDAGARALAKAISGGRLQKLDLQRNRLTEKGIKALKKLKVPSFRDDFQQEPDDDGQFTDQYLYDGDWE